MDAARIIPDSPSSVEFNQLLTNLKEQGVVVHNAACTERVFECFAGTDQERLSEINLIPTIDPNDMVMAVRGGYGLHRLLDAINWKDIAISVKQGLQICGHSDFTGFHLGLLAKTGAMSLAGPMLNYDFGPLNEYGEPQTPSAFTWRHFQTAIQSRRMSVAVPDIQHYAGEVDLSQNIQGMLWGGNLSILTTLLGTAYFPNAKQIQDGTYYFNEDYEVKEDYELTLRNLKDGIPTVRTNIIFMQHEHTQSSGGCRDSKRIDKEKKALKTFYVTCLLA